MKTKLRYTTVALTEKQILIFSHFSSIVEAYMIGYTNGKRDKSLDGHYFKSEVTRIKLTNANA